jgi:hypothetical protein
MLRACRRCIRPRRMGEWSPKHKGSRRYLTVEPHSKRGRLKTNSVLGVYEAGESLRSELGCGLGGSHSCSSAIWALTKTRHPRLWVPSSRGVPELCSGAGIYNASRFPLSTWLVQLRFPSDPAAEPNISKKLEANLCKRMGWRLHASCQMYMIDFRRRLFPMPPGANLCPT